MGSMTQGVTAGVAAYQRGKHLELLRENQAQQMKNAGIETLNKILGIKNKKQRKIMLEQYGTDIERMTGRPIAPAVLEMLNASEDEEVGTLRSMFAQAGLEMDPQQVMALMGDPYKALDFAMKVQKGKQEAVGREKRASIMGVGGQAETGGSAPEIPDTQLRTGPSGVDLGMPASPPPAPAAPPPMAAPPAPAAAPAQDDDQAEVARLNSVEDAALVQIDKLMTLGEGISEGEKRGFDAKLHAIEKRRSAILNAPGITADLAGPNGEPLVVLHTKNGAVKSILGRKPVNLDFIDGVDPKDGSPAKLAVDKNTGKTSVIGKLPPKEPGTIEERLAVAERFAQANPQDPRAQANLAQAQRGVAIKKELIGEQAEATARGTKKAALETPERPNASVIEKFAEFDTNIAGIEKLLSGAKDPEIQQVLGMSPDAIARRKSTKATAKFVTEKQIGYMAELANTTGVLRRFLVGQAQTNPEMANLLPLLPKASDPINVQVGKLNSIQAGIERHQGKLAEGLESVNIMVPGAAGRKRKALPEAKEETAKSAAELLKVNKPHVDALNEWLRKNK